MSASKSTSAAPFQHTGDESHLLRDITRTQQVLMAGFSREAGVPGSQFALMRILAKAGQDAGIMEIARELGINAAAVTRIVKDLEAERLVLRHGDAKDRRRSYVRLSARGLKIFKEVHDRSHQLERALSAVISAREIETTLSVLAKLRNLIEGLS